MRNLIKIEIERKLNGCTPSYRVFSTVMFILEKVLTLQQPYMLNGPKSSEQNTSDITRHVYDNAVKAGFQARNHIFGNYDLNLDPRGPKNNPK
jgi:hypothetical protein